MVMVMVMVMVQSEECINRMLALSVPSLVIVLGTNHQSIWCALCLFVSFLLQSHSLLYFNQVKYLFSWLFGPVSSNLGVQELNKQLSRYGKLKNQLHRPSADSFARKLIFASDLWLLCFMCLLWDSVVFFLHSHDIQVESLLYFVFVSCLVLSQQYGAFLELLCFFLGIVLALHVSYKVIGLGTNHLAPNTNWI